MNSIETCSLILLPLWLIELSYFASVTRHVLKNHARRGFIFSGGHAFFHSFISLEPETFYCPRTRPLAGIRNFHDDRLNALLLLYPREPPQNQRSKISTVENKCLPWRQCVFGMGYARSVLRTPEKNRRVRVKLSARSLVSFSKLILDSVN